VVQRFLAAVHLAEAAETGVKTLVLDKREIGTGSTSAGTVLLLYEIDVPLRELMKKSRSGATRCAAIHLAAALSLVFLERGWGTASP
jgi:hypothetical protein